MARPKPHPNIPDPQERHRKRPAVPIAGFVAAADRGVIRLAPDLDAAEYLEIAESGILRTDQNLDSGVTTLYLDLGAMVTVTSTRTVPVSTLAMRQKDDTPDGGTGTSCVDKRIEDCKKDPMRNPEFCDSKEGKRLFELLCDLLGDPPEQVVVFV